MINALIERDHVQVVRGDPVAVPVPRDDGTEQVIWRCPRCEVALFSNYGRDDVHFVRAGTFDDPAAVTPDIHIYTRSKLPWVTLPGGVPAVEAYYDMGELWPRASLDRVAALP